MEYLLREEYQEVMKLALSMPPPRHVTQEPEPYHQFQGLHSVLRARQRQRAVIQCSDVFRRVVDPLQMSCILTQWRELTVLWR